MSTADTVRAHIRLHYGLDGAIEPLAEGRADNYAVCHQGRRWLFKVFQPEYTQARIQQTADFVSFVVAAGYPAEEFVRSRDGASVVVFEGRAAVLIPWIEGHTPAPNTVSSPDALHQIGALCGHAHRLGAEYPRPRTLEYAGSGRSAAAKCAGLRRLAARQSSVPEITNEINIRTAILEDLGEELERSHRASRRGVIHGDFSSSHVVFRGDRAVGVIDLMGPLYLPGWELMRAFFQSVPSASRSPAALEAPWRAYLAGYTSECGIQPRDVAIAYDSYLLQLAGSSYGLRLPLDDGLRAFGRWRTRLASHLAEHRRELQGMMVSQAQSFGRDYS